MSVVTESSLQSRRQFVSTYLQLIGLDDDKSSSEFNTISDYHKIDSLGPSLPRFNTSLPTSKQNDSNEKTVTVKLKSIKPPRFSLELKEVSSSSTIYKVKQDVIDKQEALKSAGVSPSGMKLLVKGKVFPDAATISSVAHDGEEISFMVVVSEPSNKPSSPQKSKDAESPPPAVEESDPDASEPIVLQDQVWTEIHNILKHNLSDPTKAEEVLISFKKSMNQ